MKSVSSVLLLVGAAVAARTGPLEPRQSGSKSTPEVTVRGNGKMVPQPTNIYIYIYIFI
jgi:hypothetical protein